MRRACQRRGGKDRQATNARECSLPPAGKLAGPAAARGAHEGRRAGQTPSPHTGKPQDRTVVVGPSDERNAIPRATAYGTSKNARSRGAKYGPAPAELCCDLRPHQPHVLPV